MTSEVTAAASVLQPSVFDLIRKWATDREIIQQSTALAQYAKLEDEALELFNALLENDQPEVIDGIGDCVVCLVNIAAIRGVSIEQCIDKAYQEIKDRKGMMVNGKYVKYANLSPELQAEIDRRVSV